MTTVTAKCVTCGNTREIHAGEVRPGDMPECAKCYSVMVAVSAQGND